MSWLLRAEALLSVLALAGLKCWSALWWTPGQSSVFRFCSTDSVDICELDQSIGRVSRCHQSESATVLTQSGQKHTHS